MGGFDLALIGSDENRHAATGITQGSDEMGQMVFFARDLKPALCGAFFAFFGDDADGVGFVAQGYLLHFGGGSHFEIQWDGECVHQGVDIRVADVSTVFAQVCGDAVGASVLRQYRGPHRIRGVAAARIAHCCHVVDVHT
jgi:hypothetical protein